MTSHIGFTTRGRYAGSRPRTLRLLEGAGTSQQLQVIRWALMLAAVVLGVQGLGMLVQSIKSTDREVINMGLPEFGTGRTRQHSFWPVTESAFTTSCGTTTRAIHRRCCESSFQRFPWLSFHKVLAFYWENLKSVDEYLARWPDQLAQMEASLPSVAACDSSGTSGRPGRPAAHFGAGRTAMPLSFLFDENLLVDRFGTLYSTSTTV